MQRAFLVYLAVLLPLLLLALLRYRPQLDVAWESHPAHFWLVLAASAIACALGYAVTAAARRRRDARLLLISLAFMAAALFLGLHALATPGVLLGPNPGFELATPFGLLLASILVAVSAFDLSVETSRAIVGHSRFLLAALVVLGLAWALVSLTETPPLDNPLLEEELNGWQMLLGGVGVLFYMVGSFGYLRLYRRRGARFVLAVTLAFVLLAEAMVVIAFAQNWRISWWEWHVLMLASLTLIAGAARAEWHEERFSALYLDETLAGVKDASILFADLSGFTAYSERTSPIHVGEMLNAYFETLVPLMEEMGGEVHQLIGDAVMVVFNKQGNQPDHAVLAARAALEFQAKAAEVGAPHPEWPGFRVGVNSGEVLTGVLGGERGHRKHGLVGDTVNLAARLESQAPVGGVLVGQGTFERLPPGSTTTLVPALTLKGKSEPIPAYILHDVPAGSP